MRGRQVRAGATLLFDSDPPAEEAETVLKASAFIDALRVPRTGQAAAKAPADANTAANQGCAGKRILLIDHQVLRRLFPCLFLLFPDSVLVHHMSGPRARLQAARADPPLTLTGSDSGRLCLFALAASAGFLRAHAGELLAPDRS